MYKYHFLILICLWGNFAVKAQTDTTIVMNGLVVNGNRITIPFAEASRDVQIITRKEIQRLPVQSIPGMLTYSPGVDIRQRGPIGVQSDIGIRGGTFEQTLILLNGIKLTDPQTGHHVMNIPIPIDNIQQIEVLKGPGARKYGQNAFAGAVNLVTKVPETSQLGIRGYGGSFGSYGGNASLSLPLGKYKQFVSLSRDASDGYRHNTDYGINNVFYQSELPTNTGKYEMVFGYVDRKFGANGFYASPAYTEQYEEVKTSVLSVSNTTEINNLTIKPRVYWRWNSDRYLFVRDNPDAYLNLHKTNTIGVELNSTYESQLGITGLGVEYRKEDIHGDWVRGGTESKSNLDGFGRESFGLFADHRFKLGEKFDMTPGIFVDWYSDFGWNAFPGIDFGYNLSEKVRVYGNIGKSYRIPAFYDQYYVSPTEEGNPDLQPEEAMTYEIGLRYMNRGISFEANYFYRDGFDIIDWVLDPVDSVWRTQNIQDIKTNGIELAFGIDFTEWIDQGFPIHHFSMSYNFLNQKMDEIEGVQSRYALENIRNQVILGVDHVIFGKIKNSFHLRYIDRVEQDPYVLLDDRIYFEQKGHYMIFLEATNLTDQKYTEVMTPMPGRWIRAGVNFKISLD